MTRHGEPSAHRSLSRSPDFSTPLSNCSDSRSVMQQLQKSSAGVFTPQMQHREASSLERGPLHNNTNKTGEGVAVASRQRPKLQSVKPKQQIRPDRTALCLGNGCVSIHRKRWPHRFIECRKLRGRFAHLCSHVQNRSSADGVANARGDSSFRGCHRPHYNTDGRRKDEGPQQRKGSCTSLRTKRANAASLRFFWTQQQLRCNARVKCVPSLRLTRFRSEMRHTNIKASIHLCPMITAEVIQTLARSSAEPTMTPAQNQQTDASATPFRLALLDDQRKTQRSRSLSLLASHLQTGRGWRAPAS